jgi:hypothetical protein
VPDDPRLRFPHPDDARMLALLAEGAAADAAGPGPWSPGGWTLRTHPDLEEALRDAAAAPLRHAYGIAVLAGRSGRIVAVARGARTIALLLDARDADAARTAGAEPDPDLGPGWWRVDAFDAAVPRATQRSRLATLAKAARERTAPIP